VLFGEGSCSLLLRGSNQQSQPVLVALYLEVGISFIWFDVMTGADLKCGSGNGAKLGIRIVLLLDGATIWPDLQESQKSPGSARHKDMNFMQA